MRRLFAIVIAVTALGVELLQGQAPSESQKLNYFAGTWKLEVQLKASPVGSKVFVATEHNEWMPGRSLLLLRQEEGSGIDGGGLAVMAYDGKDKTYTYHQVKSNGESEDLHGVFQGGTWTWTSNGTPTNQALRTRLIMKGVSDTSYILRLETASEGHDWSIVMEGKATKILPRAHQDVAFLR